MKKSILAIAVASLAASSAAMADPTVYGNIHLSLDFADNDVDGANNNPEVASNTSAIGVKGSEDLGDGWKAIYKMEFQVAVGDKPDPTPDDSVCVGDCASGVGSLSGRDQFVGLKAGFGTLKFGTMSSNYKQMGGKVDPLYRTPLEGRGFLKMQSKLHSGKDINRGRMTHTAQYTTPSFGGIQLVANTTISGSSDETFGVGLRYSTKAILAYADWIDAQPGTAEADCDTVTPKCTTESAFKVGGKLSLDAFDIALQYENAKDLVKADYIFAAGTWNIDKNNQVMLTYGMQDVDEDPGVASQDTNSVAVAYNHKLSKMTNVYLGYGALSSDVDKKDESMLTAGIRKKF